MLVKLKIKYIQTLGQKKLRDEEGVFVAEGPKLVAELLRSGAVIKELFAVEEWISENRQLLGTNPVTEISAAELERISGLSTPNKVLAIVQQFGKGNKIDSKGKITLLLDAIQDPGNLGTIIRIADWFGIGQIVCSPDTADVYNPKVVQSTMGSIARVSLWYTDLASWLRDQKDTRIYAAMLEGQDINSFEKINEGILVIGNESKGISDDVLELVNVKITIPQKGKAESLNAAVATGIILSHVL
ncbi:MAG: RNA methyltransferase [Chitinophagaceae bacterium]